MDAAGWIRGLGLGVPLAVCLLAFQRRPLSTLSIAACVISAAWSFPALLATNVLAMHMGWWSFAGAEGGLLLGVPVDALITWTVLWAMLPELLAPAARLPVVVAAALWLDLMLMRLAGPVIQLGDSWLYGECVAIACVLIPVRLVSSWTRRQRYLASRAAFQAVAFGAIALLLIPAVVFEWTGQDLMAALSKWSNESTGFWGFDIILMHCAGLIALLALSAVQELVERGGGTPLPLDPPQQLVTSGLYAYVANPMQMAMTLTMLLWAMLLQSWLYAVTALVAVVFHMGFTTWEEQQSMTPRFAAAFTNYRIQVKYWRIRTRPYVAIPARLYVGVGCGPCEDLALWIGPRAAGLDLVPAQEHPSANLTRLTYECDGYCASGVEALARALEHAHFGWALFGCLLRLPIISRVMQIVVDASGGGPRSLAKESHVP